MSACLWDLSYNMNYHKCGGGGELIMEWGLNLVWLNPGRFVGNKTFRPQDVSPLVVSPPPPSRFASIFNPSRFAPHTLVVSLPKTFPHGRFAPTSCFAA